MAGNLCFAFWGMQMKNLLDKVGTRSPQLLVDNILGHMGSMYTTLDKPAEEAHLFKEESLKIQDDALSNGPAAIAYTSIVFLCLEENFLSLSFLV